VAGHVGLELRNVDANYPFERSHRFAGIQPNSGFGDYSRLSCGVGDTQLGPRATIGAVARALFIELHRGEHHCSPSRWTFTAKRACVVVTDRA